MYPPPTPRGMTSEVTVALRDGTDPQLTELAAALQQYASAQRLSDYLLGNLVQYGAHLLDAGVPLLDAVFIAERRGEHGQLGPAYLGDTILVEAGVPVPVLRTLASRGTVFDQYLGTFQRFRPDDFDVTAFSELLLDGFPPDDAFLALSNAMTPEQLRAACQAFDVGPARFPRAVVNCVARGVDLEDIFVLARRGVRFEGWEVLTPQVEPDRDQRLLASAIRVGYRYPLSLAQRLAGQARGHEDIAITLIADRNMSPEDAVRMAVVAGRDAVAAPDDAPAAVDRRVQVHLPAATDAAAHDRGER